MNTDRGMGWCPHCSTGVMRVFHGGHCPQVKAIEYYEDGTVKRIEFHGEQPASSQIPSLPETWGPRFIKPCKLSFGQTIQSSQPFATLYNGAA